MSRRVGQCTIAQLKEAIKGFKDEDIILTNPVGNLNVYTRSKDPQFELEWIAFIDLGNAEMDILKAEVEKINYKE